MSRPSAPGGAGGDPRGGGGSPASSAAGGEVVRATARDRATASAGGASPQPTPPPNPDAPRGDDDKNMSTATDGGSRSGSTRSCYLLTANPKRSNNLGPTVRCAAAFAVREVVLVGYGRFSAAGAHGAERHVRTVAFSTFPRAVEYLRRRRGRDGDGGVRADFAGADGGGGGCGVTSIVGILNGQSNRPDGDGDGDGGDGGGSGNGDVYDPRGVPVFPDLSRGVVTLRPDRHPRPDAGTAQSLGALEGKRSYPVHSTSFPRGDVGGGLVGDEEDGGERGNVCFLLGPGGAGGLLPLEQACLCDYFVHVPHVRVDVVPADAPAIRDGGGDANAPPPPPRPPPRLLDAPACLSIVLHRFAAAAGHVGRTFRGQKFDVLTMDGADDGDGDDDGGRPSAYAMNKGVCYFGDDGGAAARAEIAAGRERARSEARRDAEEAAAECPGSFFGGAGGDEGGDY